MIFSFLPPASGEPARDNFSLFIPAAFALNKMHSPTKSCRWLCVCIYVYLYVYTRGPSGEGISPLEYLYRYARYKIPAREKERFARAYFSVTLPRRPIKRLLFSNARRRVYSPARASERVYKVARALMSGKFQFRTHSTPALARRLSRAPSTARELWVKS